MNKTTSYKESTAIAIQAMMSARILNDAMHSDHCPMMLEIKNTK